MQLFVVLMYMYYKASAKNFHSFLVTSLWNMEGKPFTIAYAFN